MAKVSIKTPKGKEFKIEAGLRPKTPTELEHGTRRMGIKHGTKNVRARARSESFRTGAKAGAAGSVGNTAVNDAYELMRGGVNEEGNDDDNKPTPKPNPNPRSWDGHSGRI